MANSIRTALLLNLIAILIASPLLAQDDEPRSDDDRARALFENGLLLYNEGDYEGAIDAWTAASELSDEPLLIFNIANAYERANNFEMALDYFNQYRPYAEASERESLVRRIDNIEERLDEQRRQDEERRRLAELAAQNEGGTPVSYWVLGGTAIAGYTVFAIFGAQALSHHADLEDNCHIETGICPEDSASVVDDENSAALIADIGLGIGAAATIGLIIAVILDGSSDTPPETTGSAWFDADGGGVLVTGAF